MLYLAGLGLGSGDIPSSTVRLLKKADLYIERYTSFIPDETISFIRKEAQTVPVELTRSDLEERAGEFVAKAKSSDVVLLVGGDPLVATTHKIILNEAVKRGVAVKIMHAPSILSAAIGESGLDFYRFGQIITIPRWSDHYKPISFYEIIDGNAKRNLHTLLLLDYDGAKMSSLHPGEAAATLLSAALQYNSTIVGQDTSVLLLHNISLDGKVIKYAKLKDMESMSFENGPTLMILPAALTEIETETLKNSVTK
jgi:diphthine synthase